MLFIQPTAENVEAALQTWGWLGIHDKSPFAVTAMGDVFLEAEDGIWFLDRIEGKMTYAAETHERLQEILDSEEGQDHYLWYSLVESAHEQAMHLDDNECYDFKVAPILGGEVQLDNLEIREFELVLNVAGQVHEQIQGLPEGTEVSNIKIA